VKIKTEESHADSEPKPPAPVPEEPKKDAAAKSSMKDGLKPMRKIESKRTVDLE